MAANPDVCVMVIRIKILKLDFLCEFEHMELQYIIKYEVYYDDFRYKTDKW